MDAPIMSSDSRFRQLEAVKRFNTRTNIFTASQHSYPGRPEWDQTRVTEKSTHGEVLVVEEKTTSMRDIVIPNFKSRSSNGEIFNNPMIKTTQGFIHPLARLSLQRPTFNYGSWKRDDSLIMDVRYPLPNFELSEKDARSAYDNAIVDAYAGVTANKNNTALWLGELKETIAMLFDIGKGSKALYDMTKKQRKRWKEGKLTVEAQQQLTLQILYGVLPLEQQIAQFYEGLFQVKNHNTRETSRGYRPYLDTKSTLIAPVEIKSEEMYFTRSRQVDESLSVHIRAGCLYEIDLSDTSFLGTILDPKQIISTAYALARLSFVIDWFINVGGTLAAWSPTSGTNLLANFVSVEIEHEMTVVDTYVPSRNTIGTGNRVTSNKFVHSKWRKPIDRSDLAIIPPVNINLDFGKISALVLLFAKIKKTV